MEKLRATLKPYAPLFLRVGIGVVFFLFAIDKLNPATAVRPVAEIELILGLSRDAAMLFSRSMGTLELFIAVSFLLGSRIRWIAPLAAGMLVGIFSSTTLTFGLQNDPGLFRDIGLLGGTLTLWLLGAGPISLDNRGHHKEDVES